MLGELTAAQIVLGFIFTELNLMKKIIDDCGLKGEDYKQSLLDLLWAQLNKTKDYDEFLTLLKYIPGELNFNEKTKCIITIYNENSGDFTNDETEIICELIKIIHTTQETEEMLNWLKENDHVLDKLFSSMDDLNNERFNTIAEAHEVGHGAFRLYHTFSSENPYTEPKGQTNNLMDYNNGTHLHKYQWDYIHDPQAMIAWVQDEEEMAAFAVTDTIELQLSNVPNLFAPGNKDLEFSCKLDNIKELQEKYPDEEFKSVIQIINNENQIVFSKQNELLEEGIIKWDGSVIKENNEKEFIRSENGSYKIILSVFAGPQSTLEQLELVLSDWEAFKAAFDEDETVSIKNSTEAEFNIDINWEEWNTYEDMQVYASNNYDQYKLMCDKYKNAFDVFKDKSPMEYFSENLEEITFFGNTIKVHKDFASILTQVESNLSGTNVGTISIWQPFQMRTINNSTTSSSKISQHALGLALDINVKFNPYLYNEFVDVRYLIKRSANLDCANITNYSIEQIIEASNLFKQTFENSGFELIKAALAEISLYESDNNNNNNISIKSLKDNVIYNSLSEFTNFYNQTLIDTLIGEEERSNRLNELKNNIDSYTDQLEFLKDIISYHEKIVIYSDAGVNSIAYIEGYIDDVMEMMEDLAENIEKLENNQTPTNNMEISQMQINTTNLTAFLSERTEFYSYMPSDISSFINNLKSELKVLDEKFKNNPFVGGFCNLHPELIKAFEKFSKITWGVIIMILCI